MRRICGCGAATLFLLAFLLASALPSSAQGFVNFESGPVRPMAISPDGSRLLVTNTPDGYLEVFSLGGSAPTLECSVSVGLEPVAVAARTNDEAWVVNHLSDSVSVVDLSTCSTGTPSVTRTILVGDEPRDIVFAGTDGNRAFITAAHRGQNRPGDPLFTTEGIGRADVWVFDATLTRGALLSDPLTIVQLFTDTPRALTVSPDGTTVYAAAFHSGNQTTTINEGLVCNGGAGATACTINGSNIPGGLPAPNDDAGGDLGPETGLIVRWDSGSGAWEDRLGRDWSDAVRFALPDLDVFAIDATATPPVQVDDFASVGTILFNMTTNPASGLIYVSSTEAHNEVRFEGPGTRSSTVQGHIHEARITVIDPTTGVVTPRHLNSHINYAITPSDSTTRANSLATPLEMAVTADGQTLYLTAFGSAKIGVFDTSEIEAGTFVPDAADHIQLSAGGPAGIVLDETRGLLYVYTRFDNGLSVVNLAIGIETGHQTLHNPEPSEVIAGRGLLYNAEFTSSNGEASCAGCHVFGDFDSLSWDLGNPDEHNRPNLNPFEFLSGIPEFHPLKGAMLTQSLRGMANQGPMHWRGDRTRSAEEASIQPDGGAFDENGAFLQFNGAFVGLIGRETELTPGEMQNFSDFALSITYPPNPVRALDDSLTPQEAAGEAIYFGPVTDTVRTCNGCHTLDPAAGFFGTDGESTFENEPQHFKIAHLRNMYQKVGMFGLPQIPFLAESDTGFLGDQVRGSGFLHDGSIDTLKHFLGADVFSLLASEQRQLEAFVLAFDSNMKPIVGQQLTEHPGDTAAMAERVDLMQAQALVGNCDLIAKGIINGEVRGSFLQGDNTFSTDRIAEANFAASTIRDLPNTLGVSVTYTCVPPGTGERRGIDRDGDTHLDSDERDAGTDPADPTSFPGAPVCGNSTVEAGEQCDDGVNNGVATASCCQADCQLLPDGPANCDDNLCTTSACTAGVCSAGSCRDGESCSLCGGACSAGVGSCECVF
jgi:YVTN family beta-propeller protein